MKVNVGIIDRTVRAVIGLILSAGSALFPLLRP